MPLKSKLPRLAATFRPALDRAAYETAHDIETLGTQLAPEDTHALKDSGRTVPGAPDGSMTYAATWGGGAVDYAGYQEFGTPEMEAQPYARPAAAAIDPTFRPKAALKRWSRG